MICRYVPYFCGVIFFKINFLFPKAWANIRNIQLHSFFLSFFSCCTPISSRPHLVGAPMGPAFKFCLAAACGGNSYGKSMSHVGCPCVPLIFHKSGSSTCTLCSLGAACLCDFQMLVCRALWSTWGAMWKSPSNLFTWWCPLLFYSCSGYVHWFSTIALNHS